MNLKQRLLLLPIAIYFGLVSYKLFSDKQQGKLALKEYISLMPSAISASVLPLVNKPWFLQAFYGASGVLSLSTIIGFQPVLYIAAIVQSIIVWNITFGTITSGIEMQDLSQALNQIAYNLVVLSFIFVSLSCCGREKDEYQVNKIEKSSKKKKKSQNQAQVVEKVEESKEKHIDPPIEANSEKNQGEKKQDKKKKNN